MSQRARGRLLAMGALMMVIGSTIPSAHAFPAFARKYGVRCTACHEAWDLVHYIQSLSPLYPKKTAQGTSQGR
jgi:hypothetical protein